MLRIAKLGKVIHADDRASKKHGMFDATTGERFSGDLEIEPAEILYLAWRQNQSPSLSESKLRTLYVEHLGDDSAAMEAFMRIVPSLMTKLG